MMLKIFSRCSGNDGPPVEDPDAGPYDDPHVPPEEKI